jgi:hypothetical protein
MPAPQPHAYDNNDGEAAFMLWRFLYASPSGAREPLARSLRTESTASGSEIRVYVDIGA